MEGLCFGAKGCSGWVKGPPSCGTLGLSLTLPGFSCSPCKMELKVIASEAN